MADNNMYVLPILIIGVVLTGCEAKQVYIFPECVSPPVASISWTTEQKQPGGIEKEESGGSPQRQASMQQVDQARGQLERGKTDSAIRTLEKAVRIDPANGDAFILLARAWKQKGEKRKALEFAKKAELLFQRQPAKLKEVYSLQSELYRELEESIKNGK